MNRKSIYLQFLKESEIGYKVFGIAGAIVYSIYAISDIISQEYLIYITFELRIAIIAIALLCVYLSKIRSKFSPFILNSLVFLILILETEIQISGSVPFWEISTWFATVIFFIFASLFFLGIPRIFLMFIILYLIYYIARTSIKTGSLLDNFQNANIFTTYAYIFSIAILSYFFNSFWFRIRYNNLLHAHLTKIDHSKALDLERKLINYKLRESIFMDIHDHLGGKLLECNLSLEEIKMLSPNLSDITSQIQEKLLQVRSIIRNKMNSIAELELFSTNLYHGLIYILNSRYKSAFRDLNLRINDEILKFVDLPNDYSSGMKQLYFIISEIINNDLQYGNDLPEWIITQEDKFLIIQLNNRINKSNFNGMGNSNIVSRIEDIKGTYSLNFSNDNRISIICKIPLHSLFNHFENNTI